MGATLRYGWLAFGGATALCVGAIATAQGCTILTNDALPDDAGADGPDAAACNGCVATECTGPWAVCLLDGTCRGIHACFAGASAGSAARLACYCSADDGDAAPSDAAIDDASSEGGADAGIAVDSLAAYRMFAACNDVRTCTTCASQCTTTCSSGGSRTLPGSCTEPVDAGTDAPTDSGSDASGDAGDAGDAAVADASANDGGADAGPSDSGVDPTNVDRCASCVSTACADPKKACAVGTDCASFLACTYACTDAACATQCGVTYSAGKTAASTLSNCTITNCSGACGL